MPLCTRLKHLDISNTGCRGELIHSPLCELLRKTDSLETLSLAQNQMEGRAMRKVAFGIGKCQTLTSLSLRSTSLSTGGLAAFAEGLLSGAGGQRGGGSPVAHDRHHLGRSSSRLGEDHVMVSGLTYLDLSDNPGLSSLEAASAVAHIIANSKLEVLRLNRNPFEDAGVREIADALDPQLCPDTLLRSLELNSTRLGVPGASHLLACIARNPRLKQLKLCDNFLSSETQAGEAEMISLLEELLHLEELQLTGNRLSHGVLHKVQAVCARNKKQCAEKEPSQLRGQIYDLLFQETKLREVVNQMQADENEIELHHLNVTECKEEARKTKRMEEEAQGKLMQEIEKEEKWLEMQEQTYARWEATLEETDLRYQKAKADLRENLEVKQKEMKDLVDEADRIEMEFEQRKKEHPILVKKLQEEAQAAAEEEDELLKKATEMRKQLKKLQDQNKIEF